MGEARQAGLGHAGLDHAGLGQVGKLRRQREGHTALEEGPPRLPPLAQPRRLLLLLLAEDLQRKRALQVCGDTGLVSGMQRNPPHSHKMNALFKTCFTTGLLAVLVVLELHSPRLSAGPPSGPSSPKLLTLPGCRRPGWWPAAWAPMGALMEPAPSSTDSEPSRVGECTPLCEGTGPPKKAGLWFPPE